MLIQSRTVDIVLHLEKIAVSEEMVLVASLLNYCQKGNKHQAMNVKLVVRSVGRLPLSVCIELALHAA